jgi:signal transduction histidine kinase
MSPTKQARLTVAAVAAAVAVSFLAVVGAVVLSVDGHHLVTQNALGGVVALAFTMMGAVVVAARPAARIGWIMLAGGVLSAVGGCLPELAYRGVVARPGSVPGLAAVVLSGAVARGLGWYTLTVALPVYYPDGRLASPRWGWMHRLVPVVLAGTVLVSLTDNEGTMTTLHGWKNPITPHGALVFLPGLGFLASFLVGTAVTLAAIAHLVVRWRRGNAYERQQLNLFALAGAVVVVAGPLAFALNHGWLFSVGAMPLPFAVAVAVLARGLYDLRTAANRTLLWLALSAVVVGVYAIVIAGTGAMLHADNATWLPWAAAAVVALTFAPLRDALQRGVNRITYGRWDERYDVLASLGQRLEASADVDRLLADVVAELGELGLTDVVIRDGDGVVLAGERADVVAPVDVPLSAYGEVVGSLSYTVATPLRARDEQLVDDLAAHLGGVLHARSLTVDLQRARESLVLAREEERRRLRRDLHDGLGPALAGHLLRLDVLAGKIGPRSLALSDVDALRDELRATVLEVRRIVEGLRPPALDELGLVGALEQIVQRLSRESGLRIELSVAEDLPRLSAAMEVAVLRIVGEAVTNVVRHADASTCQVTLEPAGRVLRVTVADDGTGIAADHARSGNGLQTMRERAEELRGRLRVTSGRGTTVVAELPVSAPAQRSARRLVGAERAR